MVLVEGFAADVQHRTFFLDAIGMSVDGETVRVLHSTRTPAGAVVALLQVVGATSAYPLSCVLTDSDFANVLQHGQLRPALLH